MHRAVVRIFVCNAISKLVHIRFAKKNRSGSGKTRGHIAVFFWNKIRKNFGTCCSANTARMEIVLEGNRNAQKRTGYVRTASARPADEFTLNHARLPPRAIGEHG